MYRRGIPQESALEVSLTKIVARDSDALVRAPRNLSPACLNGLLNFWGLAA